MLLPCCTEDLELFEFRCYLKDITCDNAVFSTIEPAANDDRTRGERCDQVSGVRRNVRRSIFPYAVGERFACSAATYQSDVRTRIRSDGPLDVRTVFVVRTSNRFAIIDSHFVQTASHFATMSFSCKMQEMQNDI